MQWAEFVGLGDNHRLITDQEWLYRLAGPLIIKDLPSGLLAGLCAGGPYIHSDGTCWYGGKKYGRQPVGVRGFLHGGESSNDM